VTRRQDVGHLLERGASPHTSRLAGGVHLDLHRAGDDRVGLERLEVGANRRLDERVPVGGAADGQRELPQEHGDEALVGRVGAAGEVVEGGVEGLARDQVKRVKTRNLIGFVNFGSSDELLCLHCHSDGSNAIEDNGPQALVAATQYLSRLPRNALPRTVMILLTTGHFAGGNGSQDFCRTFKNDLVKRTNAAITIEHLGLKQWEELPSGQMGPTGQWEAGAVFAPGSKALVDDSFTALRRGRPVPASVLKPLNPDANGTADAAAWPGEGQYLYALGHIADANFITGPTYLLNWGITTKDKCDHAQVRRQAMAFTQEILRLARTPRRRLTTYTL